MATDFDDKKEMKQQQKDQDEINKLAEELADKINNQKKKVN